MPSAIDPTKPVDGVPADKADMRANFAAAKNEIEALQAVSGSDADPSQTTPGAGGEYVLLTTNRLHKNAEIKSQAASQDFEVPTTAPAGSKWYIQFEHDGCTVSNDANAGSVNGTAGGSARGINGGIGVVEVRSNPGSAPVTTVRGNVIVGMTAVTTKTYDLDDHDQEFGASGTQIFSTAAASIPNGYEVTIWNVTAGNITVDGLDADHTIPARGAVTVKKTSDGALVCVGSSGSGNPTVLDAA